MQTLKNFLKALVRVLFVLGFLMTFPLLIPMQDADLVVAQTEASLTTLMNQMHFFLPYGLIVLTVSLIGYFFNRPACSPAEKENSLSLIPDYYS